MTPSDSDSTGGDVVYTPAGTESPLPSQFPLSRSSPPRLPSLPLHIREESRANKQKTRAEIDVDVDQDLDLSDSEMADPRPMHRPSSGQSHVPLLGDDKYAGRRGRSPDAHGSSRQPTFAARRNSFRSRSPTYAPPPNLVRRKYIYSAFFLLLSLISFVVQTETAVYIQHDLKWNKAYCMMYLTHGSWVCLWPVQLLIIRIQKRKLSWSAFWRRHKYLIRTTAQMVESRDLYLSPTTTSRSPWPYMIRATAGITTFLTMAGGSWYVAVNLTTPSDLTAIYNCSAFFAYVFSIILLNDKFRLDKSLSVGLAILGVLVVAYGDKEDGAGPDGGAKAGLGTKLVGNLIIGVGSVAYGLYEVLYKKYACPPEGTSPGRGMIFANTFGSMVGLFTLTVLWIPLPILHVTGLETFEIPRGKAAWLLAISTLSNAVFSGSFLILMSLTSPVLGSVAALVTIFLVAITDWLITGKPLSGASIAGGTLIIVAFGMLAWATYREMTEEQRKRAEDEDKVLDVDEDELSRTPDEDEDR